MPWDIVLSGGKPDNADNAGTSSLLRAAKAGDTIVAKTAILEITFRQRQPVRAQPAFEYSGRSSKKVTPLKSWKPNMWGCLILENIGAEEVALGAPPPDHFALLRAFGLSQTFSASWLAPESHRSAHLSFLLLPSKCPSNIREIR